jgi:uncharacterized protein (TIGR03083 family)
MLTSGLASGDPSELGAHVVASWDAFLDLARGADLSRPSRLPGWTGHDVCVHLGSWPDHRVVDALIASTATGAPDAVHDADGTNARLLAAHRDASRDDALSALADARDEVAEYFTSGTAHDVGLRPAGSALGPLPVTTLLHAGCYELAVHALDLLPTGSAPPPQHLLQRGLAALIDVTGALASRSGVEITVTAQTPTRGWSFRSDATGWETTPVAPGRFSGTGVRGSTPDLLDTSAGRVNLAQLLLTRRLQVQRLDSFLRLAPLLHEVPGLPGGAALRTAVAGLGGVTKVLGRFRR